MEAYYGYANNRKMCFAVGNPEIPRGSKVIIIVLDEQITQKELAEAESEFNSIEKYQATREAEIAYYEEEAKLKAQTKIAKNLIRRNMPFEDISNLIGLDVLVLEKLKGEIEEQN